jgi:hypothetical protein
VRTAWWIIALVVASTRADAQERVTVADVGRGASGRVLQEALRRPYRLVEPDTSWFILGRSEQERRTIVVLGRTAAISGKVDGDVIVVDGDLHIRPGAEISGRAIAIGGGVYSSSLSYLAQGSQSFRDNTFDIQRTADGYQLHYRSLVEDASRPLLFPGIYGLRFPSYDRVNGLSIPFGPAFSFAGGRGTVEPIVTYRSDLGKFDPLVSASFELTRRTRAQLEVQRGTFSNDAWIWPNLVNSLSVLAFGADTRNYYRADRGEITIHRVWESTRSQITPFIGARVEQAWSVGPAIGEQRGPWSVWRRTDTLGMWRPNPSIVPAGFLTTLTSALGGAAYQWDAADLKMRARSSAEWSIEAPVESFTQLTSDLETRFLTFGEQEYAIDVHWVTTYGPTPPPQRFVYFGGPGTTPFLELLEQGGDELLLVDQRYSIPLVNVRFGILGVPSVQLRHRIGSAGLGKLPSLEQMIGVGLSLTIVRAEIQVEPTSGKVRFSTGFTFSR